MTSTLFFLFALLIISTYCQFLKTHFNDPHQILTELDRSHFGNTLLSTISIHLSTETPIEDVNSLLSEIKEQLEEDQSTDDVNNATNQAICDKNIQEYENNIKYHNEGMESNEELVSQTNNLLTNSQSNHEKTIKDLTSNNERYSDGEATRVQENQDYLNHLQEHDDALSAVAEAQQLVQSLQSGALFIQLKGKFQKITQKLNEQKTKQILYQPIIKSLAELASHADQETTRKIIALLQSLAESLEESKTTEEAIETQQSSNWEQLSKDLLNERQTLTQKKQNLEESIGSYEQIIIDAEEKITQHSNQLESNKNLLEQQKNWCVSTGENYVWNSKERENELETLQTIIEHLEEKFNSMKEYLKERANVDF